VRTAKFGTTTPNDVHVEKHRVIKTEISNYSIGK
jgi:hypothetical protein